jgi:hypothetical protein
MTATLYDFSEYSFIPGPAKDPPADSLGLHEITLYSPEVVADAFLSCRGMRMIRAADPSWWDWAARWECEDRFIEVGMALFDTEPVAWGGSGIVSRCGADELLTLWEGVRRRCPAVWLHSSACEILTPQTFRERFR